MEKRGKTKEREGFMEQRYPRCHLEAEEADGVETAHAEVLGLEPASLRQDTYCQLFCLAGTCDGAGGRGGGTGKAKW